MSLNIHVHCLFAQIFHKDNQSFLDNILLNKLIERLGS